METLSSIERRASRIKLLLMDCDGVLTDGRIFLSEDGGELKSFNTKDGLGIKLLHLAGLKAGIISGRAAKVVERRARELDIEFLHLGDDEKLGAFEALLLKAGVEENAVGFIGDDLTDISCMERSELAVAVADAAEETKAAAHYVTKALGGHGAVREVVELILKAQGRWSEVSEW